MARNGKAPPGYIGIGTRYISMTFLLALSLGILMLLVLYATTLHPVVVRRWYAMQNMPEFRLDSPYLADYTGSARLVLSDGTLLYEGAVESAAAHGEGRLFENGKLVYEGGFNSNEFSGHGKLYDGGEVLYEGEFASNTISGKGRLYKNGALVYEGSFSGGLYNGPGTEYERGGAIYSGGFADGLRDGAGTQYEGGRTVYTGGFSAGLYCGAGKLYGPDGRLLYDGEFLAGLYDGKGRLYRNGVLMYDGEFAAGMYNGTGTEYNTETGYPVFSGKYSDNARMKAGVLYDENGEPILPSDEPLPRPDPLSLLGKSYSDAVTYLARAEVTVKEQTIDNELFVIDEGEGVIYSFRVLSDGSLDYLSRIYYYGLLSVGSIVVGADVSDIPGGISVAANMNAPELLVLGYSNALWGRDATAAKSRGMMFGANGFYTVTAFYLPPEPPVIVMPEAEEPEEAPEDETAEETVKETVEEPVPAAPAAPPEPSGRILFLRIDYLGKG